MGSIPVNKGVYSIQLYVSLKVNYLKRVGQADLWFLFPIPLKKRQMGGGGGGYI